MPTYYLGITNSKALTLHNSFQIIKLSTQISYFILTPSYFEKINYFLFFNSILHTCYTILKNPWNENGNLAVGSPFQFLTIEKNIFLSTFLLFEPKTSKMLRKNPFFNMNSFLTTEKL